MDAGLAVLLAAIDQAFRRKSWHGPNLRGALRGVTAEQASWRPAPGRHNIWELALHAAYWKYVVVRRLRGSARGTFPLPGRDFFVRPFSEAPGEPGPSAAGAAASLIVCETDWRRELELLNEMHRELHAAIAALPAAAIDRPVGDARTTARDLILGAAAHDVYHAGQIQLIKRLRAGRTA
ncbi:MAG TPA: DinB family protein [Thermoanaerobaculia bacterium]|nr:DinB family protein [Thermoanaerobaculia bacterium]